MLLVDARLNPGDADVVISASFVVGEPFPNSRSITVPQWFISIAVQPGAGVTAVAWWV
jgi:hypothetical protein